MFDVGGNDMKYRIFLYKRGIAWARNFSCPANTAESVVERMIEKYDYDGALVVDGNGIMKSLYGYCGV